MAGSGCVELPRVLILAVLLLLLRPGLSPASHVAELPAGETCQNCHTLSPSQGIFGTSYINTGVQTLTEMVSEGWEVGDKFGCTFCHNNSANDAGGVMVNVLDDFTGHASIHPVGWVRGAATDTSLHEYASNWDGIDYSGVGGGGVVVTDQLDCIDCHDPALLMDTLEYTPTDLTKRYANHLRPTHPNRSGNPFMLRDVTSMDNFCRGCHGSSPAVWWTARGKDPIPALPHAEANLTEADGTIFKTSTCTDCHDEHKSGNNVSLLNDGTRGDPQITSTNCTEVCHYPGDDAGWTGDGPGQNTYTRHGHGKPASTYKYAGGVVDFSGSYTTLNFNCTRCHVNLDPGNRTPGRKPHIENPATADPKDDYIQRFNLNSVLQPTDSESVFGNPVLGICRDCHGTYDNHTGGAGDTGCQDCHDEHGEGSGATSNLFMIPEFSKENGNFDPDSNGPAITRTGAGTEPVTYDTPRLDPATGVSNDGTMDLYKGQADDTGLCDNADCHSGAAWWGGSLYDSMMVGPAPANAHSGGSQDPDIDCSFCHKHNGDAGGGWRAQSAGCDTCHNFPPDGGKGFVNHLGGGGGNRSRDGGINPNTSASTDTAFFTAHGQCDVCHGISDNGTGDGFGTPVDKTASSGDAYDTSLHNDGNVHLNGISTVASGVDPSAPDDDGQNADYTRGTKGCSRGCHTVPAEDWAFIGVSARPVQLLELGSGACDACHGGNDFTGATANNYWPDAGSRGTADGGTVNDQGAHEEHMRALARKAYGFSLQEMLDDGSADTNQVALCEYCHTTRIADLDHYSGDDADMAANFKFMDGSSDNGAGAVGSVTDTFTGAWGGATCTNMDCHYEETTPAWYSSDATGNADCTHCHTGISTHISGGCTNCHPGGTTTGGEKHVAAAGVVLIPAPSPSWDDPGTTTGESIDMRSRLGLTYAVFTEPLTVNSVPNTPYPGVHLGGDGTSGTTEADICWGCHGAPTNTNDNPDTNADNSEWGYNFDPDGATWPKWLIDPDATMGTTSLPRYNYGYLYTLATGGSPTADWTAGDGGGAFRRNAYQNDTARLSKQIFSVHSANVDDQTTTSDRRAVSSVGIALGGTAGDIVNKRGAAANLEHKAQIRCSYCHDVHDTFGPNGRPYVRGNWGPNPYPEDMPPRSGNTYPTRGGPDTVANAGNGAGNRFQARNATGGTTQIMTVGLPRLFAHTYTAAEIGAGEDLKGGYWIDLNSGNPPGSAPYNDTVFDTTNTFGGLCALCHTMGVDTLDYYRTSSLWQGTANGHRNSTQGGAGTSGNNLFNAQRTGGVGNYMANQDGVSFLDWGKDSGYDGGIGPWSNIWDSPQPCGGNNGNDCPQTITGWYGGTAGQSIDQPQGSYNTWYGTGTVPNAHKFPCSKCHSPHATGLPALLVTNCLDQDHADWSANSNQVGPHANTALRQNPPNNCHRKTSSGDGWNKLLPQQ